MCRIAKKLCKNSQGLREGLPEKNRGLKLTGDSWKTFKNSPSEAMPLDLTLELN
jgi:hypothetical protein